MSIGNCYIYTRVSTANQVDGYSLDAQTEALRNYADYKDLNIAGEYCDAGRSGMDTKNRPAFRQMMDDVMSQKDNVRFVLVFKLSRFGRNAADILRSIQILDDHEVNLVSVDESIDSSTAGGRLTLSILSAVAEMEHENISSQFFSGKIQKISDGSWAGGHVPYGYTNSEDGLVPDPYEAEVVRRIFELYETDDGTARSVAISLEDSPFVRKDRKSGETKPFTYRFIARILDNPIYCGRLWFNRRTNRKDHDGKPIGFTPDHAFMVQGKHEAIVSEETWDRIHEKRKRLAEQRVKRNSNVHILSGLLKCPVCGKGLVGNLFRTKLRNGKEGYSRSISYYICRYSKKENGSLCSFSRKLNQEIVDGFVFGILGRISLNREFGNELEKAMRGTGSAESLELDLRNLRRELADAESRKVRLGEQIDGLNPMNADYDAKYERLSLRLDEIYDLIDELEDGIKATRTSLESLNEKAMSFSNLSAFLSNLNVLIGKMTPEERKELYGSIIDRIELFPEERADGRIIKIISFRFPLLFDGKDLRRADGDDGVCLTLDCSGIEIDLPEKGSVVMKKLSDGSRKAVVRKNTYDDIKEFVSERFGEKVSSLAIAQTKRKFGLVGRDSFNKPKSPKTITPRCTPHKEQMILEALVHLGMIDRAEIRKGEMR